MEELIFLYLQKRIIHLLGQNYDKDLVLKLILSHLRSILNLKHEILNYLEEI